MAATPIKDELFFIKEINLFAKNGFWGHIQLMKIQQGPLLYYFMGVLKSCFGLSFWGMRLLNVIFSSLLIYVILRIFEIVKIQKIYILLVLLNPYFLFLTGPLLYNDNLALLAFFLGILFFLKNKHLISSLFFSSACLMRQNLIFALAAIFIMEVLINYKKPNWEMLFYLLPLLSLFSLMLLWGGRLTSPGINTSFAFLATGKGFNLNAVELLRSFCYQIILLAAIAIAPIILKIQWKLSIIFIFITTFFLFYLIPPTHINFKFHQYLSIYDQGGYLDKLMSEIGTIGILFVALLVSIFIDYLILQIKLLIKSKSQFELQLLVFIVLNLMFYSMTPFWDKYYVMMGALLPIVLNNYNRKQNTTTN